MLWLVRVSPATELPAVSKAYPADIGVSNASFNVNNMYSHGIETLEHWLNFNDF